MKNKNKNKKIRCRNICITFLSVFLLTACGGGSSPSDITPPEKMLQGIFVDSAVSNIRYRTETQNGVTDREGRFFYLEGETVIFSIGGIHLPSVTAKAQVTPLDIFNSTDSTSTKVVNLSRLLQSLDADGDTTNGIRIHNQVHEFAEPMTLRFDSPSFDDVATVLVANGGSGTGFLVDAEAAIDHLQSTLQIEDADNDGIEDSLDNCPEIHNRDQADANLNNIGDVCDSGEPSGFDYDRDGLPNETDPDDDNDGVPDEQDRFPLDENEYIDTDLDGIGNYADTDDDNDGVPDINDAFPLLGTESEDFDSDGIGNNADNDDDNDSIPDSADAFPLDPSEYVDSDLDGIGDGADPDDDNDGTNDLQDAFPYDETEALDSDLDGVGNNADTDDDNDGVNDELDAFPLNPLEQTDTDNDGIGNNSDEDDDNDGVSDDLDPAPLDPTESVDTDGDGIGNNSDTDDDGDGVADTMDFAPLDTNCSLEVDTEDSLCKTEIVNNASRIVKYGEGVIYFLVEDSKRLYPWDLNSQSFTPTIQLGGTTSSDAQITQMALVDSHNRLYFGYSNGTISYIESDGSGIETSFFTLPLEVKGLASAGNYLVAQDESGAWNTHYVISADGVLRDSQEWNQYSRVYAWNSILGRLYFFRDDSSPNDIHYEEINQSTGVIDSEGESPYHGDYSISPPLVASEDGMRVLIGSGNFFDADTLNWQGAIAGGFADAVWDNANGLIVIRSQGGRTVIQNFSPEMQELEVQRFDGDAIRILSVGGAYHVISSENNHVIIREYTPSNDTDNDGVTNLLDAFPLDPAASIDSDNDGAPDNWNAGMSQSDSTSGLVLDAYPNNSACFLEADGDGFDCDYNKVIQAYEPDAVSVAKNGIIYLLEGERNRVYRWSKDEGGYIAPYVVGEEDPLGRLSPNLMEYAPDHDRLYFGYDDGRVTYIDLLTDDGAEQPFVVIADAVRGIGAAGQFLLLQDNSGAWATHYIYDVDGNLKDSKDWNYYSRDYAWNSSNNRIYFFRDATSPNDLHFEELSDVTGEILSDGESPYHGDYFISPPILVSPNGTEVLLGSGDIYNADTVEWDSSLANGFVSGIWLDSGEIITLRDAQGNTHLDHYVANLQSLGEADLSGEPVGIFISMADIVVITSTEDGLVFTDYVDVELN